MGKGGGFGPRLSSDTVPSLHFLEPRLSLCERGSATPAVPSCQAWVCTKCSIPGGHSVRGEGAAITVVLDKRSSFVAVSQPASAYAHLQLPLPRHCEYAFSDLQKEIMLHLSRNRFPEACISTLEIQLLPIGLVLFPATGPGVLCPATQSNM